MPEVKSFPLPDLGEGLTDAELVSWFVAVGDTVELNQIIAEVETAKASVELPSPYAGTVTALHAAEGATIDVGTPIIDIDTGEDSAAAPAVPTKQISAAAKTGTPERIPVLVGYGVAGDGRSRRHSRPAAAGERRREVVGGHGVRGRPLAKPPVRFYANQHGVDIAEVTATGPHGDVTRDDITDYLAARQATETSPESVSSAPVVAGSATGDETRVAIKGVRKHTAAAMVTSAFTAPHVTEFVTVDVTPMLELLDNLRAHRQFTGVRLTPLALIAKALLIALRGNPSLNSHWDDEAQEIVTKHYVNLGIAAATPRGLMVPNIKHAHQLSLRELADALVDLTLTAKEGKTGPADLSGGTITITNVGVFGVDAGTPILNPGEAAILCFGAIRKTPWEFEGDIALRSVTTLSLSFDHRLVDGEQGSKFLADIGRILSDPLEFVALG
ncbi:dihydrolipoamide acetyltransferase family protein [Rhodococcus sp. WAY2]|uniref:dihydrolipoamide acetyltransferase family protein n=1 Tax=Rhodococcus sp. WAY2 TaxID=2663121 RepID=UPI00131FB3F4|nr:dihydrolipoamide acetyltransferase family protein [Rhodococcus sp. WAY2]QHE69928.1 Dihydrolipoamide acetyltransferase component of pyruvate dehydrogenase complex [Rhodococcus sp. WAY2]